MGAQSVRRWRTELHYRRGVADGRTCIVAGIIAGNKPASEDNDGDGDDEPDSPVRAIGGNAVAIGVRVTHV